LSSRRFIMPEDEKDLHKNPKNGPQNTSEHEEKG
jgi:hypothetical protein